MKTSTFAFIVGGGLVAVACGDNLTEPVSCDRTIPGNICTIAGMGPEANGYSGDEGPALEARFSLPMDTLTAPDGSVYIDDWNNHRIRRLDKDGIIHFIAGNGEIGGSIDDPATGNFNHPTGLLFNEAHTQIIMAAWHNSQLMTLDLATGTVGPSCGDGRRAYFGDDKPAFTASLNLPSSIAWSKDHKLTIMDQANQVIRQVDAAGNIHRIAGQCVVDTPPPDGPGACALGVLPVACPGGSNVTTCGVPAETCSKPCWPSYGGDEGPALDMRMAQQFSQSADPGGRIIYDADGNLYFADVSNALIRMVDANGIVHRVAGVAPTVDGAQIGYSGDGGPALAATLNHPIDLSFGSDGTLYFSDVFNHCIRAIAPDHTIRTVVGQCGTKGNVGDGVPATEALLNRPYGVEFVAPNTLYVSDTGNSVIRAVNLK